MSDELKSLRKELTDLSCEFGQRVDSLERRIGVLESTEHLVENSNESEDSKNSLKAVFHLGVDVESAENRQVPAQLNITPSNKFQDKQRKHQEEVTVEKVGVLKEEVKRQSVLALLSPYLGPFLALFEKFIGVYQYYKKQGKAPVFFMTATGVAALVLGFSYLLQYSFNEYLSVGGKVAIGFMASIAITAGGIWFTRKREDMSEYGSSLIALGIILNYLCAYFVGPYYDLLPEVVGFSLFVGITIASYIIALLFEARIVAVVTLLGGATMPLIMDHVDQSPLLYLSFLFVLTIATLHLSLRIRWQQLAFVAMVLSAGMIEFSVSNLPIEFAGSYGLIMIIHGFFYAFGYYSLRGLSASNTTNNTTSNTITAARLIIVTSNLMFFLYICQQLSSRGDQLGVIFLVNAFLWLSAFLVPSKLFRYSIGSEEYRAVQAVALLHIGLLVGVAVLILSSPDMMGLIWSLEGLMLLYLGGRFKYTSVRVEGYIALLLSFFSMGYQIVLWLYSAIAPLPHLLTLNINLGWGNLIAMTAILFVATTLMARIREELNDREMLLKLWLDNIFSVFIVLGFLMSIGILTVQGMWLFSVVPMFYLVWRAQSNNLVFTELVGLCCFGLIFIPMIVSASMVGNTHFSEQSLFAQVARIEAFLSLWLIAEFYKRYCSQSANLVFAENLRKLFYCLIPVFFLPSVLRQHSEYFPLVLWLSSIIALLLFSRLQFSALKFEMRLLVLCASAVALYSCWRVEFNGWQGNATAALLGGLVFYIVIGWKAMALYRTPIGSVMLIKCHNALKPLFSFSVYYFSVAIFIIVYGVSAKIDLALLASTLYFTGIFFYRPVLAPIRKNLRILYTFTMGVIMILTLMHAYAAFSGASGTRPELMLAFYNAIALGCGALLIYHSAAQNRAVWRVTGRQILNIWFLNLMFVVAYISLLEQLFSSMLGPAVSVSLVVHGTIILFQTLKPRMKKLIVLSVVIYVVAALKILLVDIQDFSLIQKIIVFMLIGLSMLGAAFMFQKVTARDVRSGHDIKAENI